MINNKQDERRIAAGEGKRASGSANRTSAPGALGRGVVDVWRMVGSALEVGERCGNGKKGVLARPKARPIILKTGS